MKSILIKIHWILSNQFGFNLLLFINSISRLPKYFSDWIEFKRNFKGKMTFMPCIHDRHEESGTTKSEYFWQDLMVARKIYQNNPYKHVDVGSRVDGFVAHVASFREIEVLDIRPLNSSIPGVKFTQADLMEHESISYLVNNNDGYCDSVSCLHALEHFGLGRYGDKIKTEGFKLGIKNLSALLKPQGILYLSTPMGRERVEFNANWIFSPSTIIETAKYYGLQLSKLGIYQKENGFVEYERTDWKKVLGVIESENYCLVLCEFIKD